MIDPRELPMLFSDAMVRAILAGAKTQTRRVVTARTSLVNGEPPCMSRDPEIISAWPQLDLGAGWLDPGPSPAGNPGPYLKVPGGEESVQRVYSRIQPGDRLWVRECWCQPDPDRNEVAYRANMSSEALADEQSIRRVVRGCVPWRPSIFMPRWASRITLDVTSVRAQRLQEISDADIAAEGVASHLGQMRVNGAPATGFVSAPYAFSCLWNGINGKRDGCAWADNPWVWAISFRRLP